LLTYLLTRVLSEDLMQGIKEADIVLASPVRTPIGALGGALKDVSPLDLGAAVISAAVERAGLKKGAVDRVVLGEIIQTTERGNPAREAALRAALVAGNQCHPFIGVSAYTVNINCGSGLLAVRMAAMEAACGEAEVVVAGGMESMSSAPFLAPDVRWGRRLGHAGLLDSLQTVAVGGMGLTVEKLAEKLGISRRDQDAFALESHQRTVRSWNEGRFNDEIVPIKVPQRKGDPVLFARDESPRPDTSLEKLAKLPTVFKEGGTLTAGNSSPISDGAAALIVTRRATAERLGIAPMARVLAFGASACEPDMMGIAPVAASRQALDKAGLSLGDIALIELNEAFAAQSLAVIRELGLPREKTNVNGGGIAIGHPVGASGVRILVTLLHELRRRRARHGLATLCIGGGQGIAIVVEALH
jgi:acetyl-CoA C-acetyltransferase